MTLVLLIVTVAMLLAFAETATAPLTRGSALFAVLYLVIAGVAGVVALVRLFDGKGTL